MRMTFVWIGALLIVGGVVYTAWEGNWKGRFRSETHTFTTRGFGFGSNWPGLAMIGIGALMLLAGAAFVG